MSTPICSRCQKIYTAGSAPAKCVNCGGDVKSVEKKVATPPIAPKPAQRGSAPANKVCNVSGCPDVVTMAVKYYYDGKKILMAPSPEAMSADLIELCTKHAQGYKAATGWTLVHGESFPTPIEFTRQNMAKNQSSGGDGDGCIGNFFFIVMVFAFWGVVIIGGGWLVIEFFGWLFNNSGGGGGGDGTTQPFRLPFRRRK